MKAKVLTLQKLTVYSDRQKGNHKTAIPCGKNFVKRLSLFSSVVLINHMKHKQGFETE